MAEEGEGEDKADPYANDPFFKQIPDGQWNACIGRQGHEENYLDGYIEAAIELTEAIFEKKMFDKRDTLVLPILYNARHAIELALKFASRRLIKAGVIKDDGRRLSHNIKAYWEHLHKGDIGDEKLSQTVVALEPYVDSLSRIDSDGQELRYHRNRDDSPSLAAFAVANLRLIRISLRSLKRLLSALKYRTIEFIDERATGTFTNRCSRTDLLAIARLMPPRANWNSQAFDDQKAVVKTRYGLGNRQFSIALDCIQKSREMRSVLGVESSLLHLTDDDIVLVAEQWRIMHPVREHKDDDLGLDYWDTERSKDWKKDAEKRRAAVNAIAERLSPEKLAELETMFYSERDRIFVEHHEDTTEYALRKHAATSDPKIEIMHLMEKTSFLQYVQGAATRLGRLVLADRLKVM